jgi:nitrile hydratase
MGGRFGDGSVEPNPDEKIFEEAWHGRALAVTLASGALGQWNIDMSRHAREKLSPKDYARFSYYEKWISALADLLAGTGVVTRAELAGGDAQASDLANRKLTAARVPDVLATGAPADRPSDIAPVFDVGDRVQTRRITANRFVDGGHTRLPRYAAGAIGHIVRYHGTHVLPDSAAHGLGDAAEPLYTVAFPSDALWANPEHARDEVMLDLWQSYLEPAR